MPRICMRKKANRINSVNQSRGIMPVQKHTPVCGAFFEWPQIKCKKETVSLPASDDLSTAHHQIEDVRRPFVDFHLDVSRFSE